MFSVSVFYIIGQEKGEEKQDKNLLDHMDQVFWRHSSVYRSASRVIKGAIGKFLTLKFQVKG